MRGLYRKTENGYWYYQPKSRKGEPRPKAIALGTKDELEAMTRAREARDKADLIKAEVAGTMEEALEKYYKAKSENTKSSRKGRERILNPFCKMMGNPRMKDIDVDFIKQWRKRLSTLGGSVKTSKPVSPSTMTSYLITLKAFLNWAVEEGYMKENPVKFFKGATTVKITRSQEFLTIEQREKLLSEPCRDYIGLILHLGFFAGLRDGEMLACNPDWIWISEDGKKGTITVQDTEIKYVNGESGWWRAKDKEARKIPMHPRLIEFLKTYGMRRPYLLAPDKPLWPNDDILSKRFDAKRALNTHGKKCGINKLGFHILRHSFSTHLFENKKPINQIAALLGDTVRVTERHYIGYSEASHDVISSL